MTGSTAARAPFTAHSTIDTAIIRRGDEVFQACRTLGGARALVDLLNRAVATVDEHGADITTARPPAEIVASALARAFDWRLELDADRERRIAAEKASREMLNTLLQGE